MSDYQSKFQQLLRELFQFDSADLDFGIYRIMNHKREVIERFISEDLPQAIAEELERGVLAEQSRATQELEAARKKVLDALGDDALDAEGNLAEKYSGTKAGREYLAAQTEAAGACDRQALEAAIYNHLYTFFSRYYQDGDFISKRRYSKRERYAIPYNGEEVTLYWANHDQYYTKTAEHFTDYTYKAPNGVTVHFKLQAADVEQDNVKGEKRFFLPCLDGIAWDEETPLPSGERVGVRGGEVVIPFEYRPLTQQEAISYGKSKQQDEIIAKALETIPRRLAKSPRALAALTAERRKTADGDPVSYLEHHLRQYTRRNTSDFFIHKDLKGFLSRELDFYLKNEVLNLEEMEAAGEGLAGGWFQMLRLIKAIGNRIIAFLAQIENFQKMLWEKRKFITETFYCITVGQIDEAFYPEIAACEAQWDEWRTLYHIDDRPQDRLAFLRDYPTLVLDTRHFSLDPSASSGQGFVDRLLASFDDPSTGSGQGLDEMTDGLLIHSENFQALSLLLEKYRVRIKCVYIDPPYNAKSSEIIYKNTYKHSSWLSLIENRLRVSHELMMDSFVLVIAIDEVENMRLGIMLSEILPDCEDVCVSVMHNPTGQQGENFSFTHDFAHFVYPRDAKCIGIEDRDDPLREAEPDVRPLRNVSSGRNHLRESGANCFYPILVKDGQLVGFGDVCSDDYHPDARNVQRDDGVVEVYPIDPSGVESKWVFARETVPTIQSELSVKQDPETGTFDIIRRKSKFRYKSLWSDKRYSANSWGSVVLNNILPENPFTYPKSIFTVMDCVDAGLNNAQEGIVLDYFGGSGTTGHAVINLNREDGGRRKFILVEMADYFDTVLLPRLKKVTFTPEWKNGKPKRMATPEEAERSPRIMKVIRLESYEDALNNITFDDASGQTALQFDDYLLQYMLTWETRRSETLLNVEQLARPFSYQLHIHRDGETRTQAVDLPETFNYLLGLHVQTRRVYYLPSPSGRGAGGEGRYLVYRGLTREGRKTAVIWRETEGWQQADYERDRQFVAEHNLAEGADEVYVNGDSLIPGARALETLFKARMFAEVEG